LIVLYLGDCEENSHPISSWTSSISRATLCDRAAKYVGCNLQCSVSRFRLAVAWEQWKNI